MPTEAARRIRQFYSWEQLGRGWLLAEHAVELEPPFSPFYAHEEATPYIDDGRRHTWLSKIIAAIKGEAAPVIREYPPPDIAPLLYLGSDDLVCLCIGFPKQYKTSLAALEQFFVMLSYRRYPVSFEIIAGADRISIQLVCREPDRHYIEGQLQVFFHGCTVTALPDTLADIVYGTDTLDLYTVDYGLREEFMRPIAQGGVSDPDSYQSLFGMLDQLHGDEQVLIQILFCGTCNPWSAQVLEAVSDRKGGSLFYDAPEMPTLAADKTARPLFAVCVRALTAARGLTRASALLDNVTVALHALSTSKSNALIPLMDHEYEVYTRLDDIVNRESHRLGMLLNSRELATLAHVPSASIVSHSLVRTRTNTKAAPDWLTGHPYTLGTNTHQGVSVQVSLSIEQRLRHLHIVGATGTGKSSLMIDLIAQDIAAGHGICTLDPHGDLIEAILTHIPEERINDVILIDPNDSEYPIGLNLLTAHSDIEKEVLSSDLVALFRRFSTSWGDQMNSVFANAILAFLDNTKSGTLTDLRRFLIEKPFRETILKTVTDPDIAYYWQHEYPILKSTSIGPILTRLDTFLRPKLIRTMVSQPTSIDFSWCMDTKKIVLVKLSEGLMGAENSYLLGAVLVSKVQQAAMARQAVAAAARIPFFLYIDEFHHFLTPSMTSILSGARKYGLGLIVAHQDMSQVSKYETELANALIANAGTRLCLRLGESDAKKFQEGFSSFTADDLLSLSQGEAIARVNQTDADFNLKTNARFAAPNREELRDRIVAASRSRYAASAAAPLATPVPPPSEPEPPDTPLPAPAPLPPAPPIAPPAAEAPTRTKPSKPKGPTMHRYHQTLIKKVAESIGYKAGIEMPTPDGKGRVDILLEKDDTTIAVEVSDTTDAPWELQNITKCLNAGYNHIYSCSDNRSMQQALRSQLPETALALVSFVTVDALILELQQQARASQQPEAKVHKGYRVTVQYSDSSHEVGMVKEDILRGIVGKGTNTGT